MEATEDYAFTEVYQVTIPQTMVNARPKNHICKEPMNSWLTDSLPSIQMFKSQRRHPRFRFLPGSYVSSPNAKSTSRPNTCRELRCRESDNNNPVDFEVTFSTPLDLSTTDILNQKHFRFSDDYCDLKDNMNLANKFRNDTVPLIINIPKKVPPIYHKLDKSEPESICSELKIAKEVIDITPVDVKYYSDVIDKLISNVYKDLDEECNESKYEGVKNSIPEFVNEDDQLELQAWRMVGEICRDVEFHCNLVKSANDMVYDIMNHASFKLESDSR